MSKRETVRFLLFGATLSFCSAQSAMGQSATDNVVNLESSGSITLRSGDSTVVQNLFIEAGLGVECAIDIKDLNNVVIKNVEIRHANVGICARNAANLTIENVRLISTSMPSTGPHCEHGVAECFHDKKNWANPNDRVAIFTINAENSNYSRISIRGAATGFYVNDSPNTQVSSVTCEDMRGPFPRGQCAQFVRSDGSSIDNFYAKNIEGASHGEDNINAFKSDNVTVSNGLIDGNFSIHGIGVIADSGADDMRVLDVDVTNTANGALNVWSNDDATVGRNFYAENIRVKNTQCESRQGLIPSSGGLIAANHPMSVNSRFVNVQYFNHCRKFTTFCMPGDSCRLNNTGSADIREEDFTLKQPLKLVFPWEVSSPTILDVQIK